MATSSFLPDLLDDHVETAAFLWSLRAYVSDSRAHTLADLARIDDRLEAHLDALVLAAAEVPARADEVGGRFVAAFVAVRAGHLEALAEAMRAAEGDASAEHELAAALGWAPAREAAAALDGVAAAATADARGPVARVARRCRVEAARWHLHADDGAPPGALRGEALTLERAARASDPAAAEALLRGAAARGQAREAIEAAAAWGDPRVIPWLLALMTSAPLARLAGWAVATLTGVDLTAARLVGEAPVGFRAGPSDSPLERDVGVDPDARLPWPAAARAAAWWAEAAARFPPGTALLLGRPRDAEALTEALRGGTQWVRRVASYERWRLAGEGRRAHFPVDAPAFRQVRALGAWSGDDVAGR